MYNAIPDVLRKMSIEDLFSTPTLQLCWPIWKAKITSILCENFNEMDLINLGDHLSDIFQSTGGEGRGQGQLSGGGVAWESLVCWYINLCTIGSRTVAVRKMSLVPKPIQDAITVNYGNFPCNTESDITVIVFPDRDDYNVNIHSLDIEENGSSIEACKKGGLNSKLVDLLCSRDFEHYEIGIIQCKTNWNDNAQIPMLWDMIYSANGFKDRSITIGRNSYNIHDASNFTYSFVTVPSNQRANYQHKSVAVQRVAGLSGGNYWGRETNPNVARSIKEIFTNNFQTGYKNNIRADIRKALQYLGTHFSYFDVT